MGTYNRTLRRNRGEDIGTVDRAFDDDRPSSHPLIQDDAACAVAWLHDDFQAIEVFVDPALTDRQAQICEAVNLAAAANNDIDGLSEGLLRYAASAGLSAGIYERPPDALTENIVAVVFALG
jgi:hypothetical protein